jgi:hypothetical protein
VMRISGGAVYVVDSLNVSRIFNGRLTYDKGAAIVHILRYLVNNDDLFFTILKEFQKTFSHSTANGLDVKNFFEAYTDIDFLDFFEQWYFGEGYPTYAATWNSNDTTTFVNITHTTSSSITPEFTNPIDLTFSRENNTDTTVRVNITSNNTYVEIENLGLVTDLIAIDKDNWIMNRTGSITEDITLSNNTTSLKQPTFKIYPNPTAGILNYELPNNKYYTIEIYDVLGNSILKTNTTNQNNVDISAFKTGSYLVHFIDKNNERQIKILIKN